MSDQRDLELEVARLRAEDQRRMDAGNLARDRWRQELADAERDRLRREEDAEADRLHDELQRWLRERDEHRDLYGDR